MQKLEIQLAQLLGCLARKRTQTGRRRFTEDEDLLVPGIDPFFIDTETKIIPSKAARRLLSKTQVLTNPNNLHIRKRITHSAEVTSVASFMSALLGLNVECTKAISLGHDIGHPPFGHDGEAFLNTLDPSKPFRHEVMGVVIAQHVEREGAGLNLTHETLCGIMRDAWPLLPGEPQPELSEEAKVVMWADRFAYITGDYNDMLRIGYPIPKEISDLMSALGENQRRRVNTLEVALVKESARLGSVTFKESLVAHTFLRIKDLMYESYRELNASNATSILGRIYEFIKKVVRDIDPALVLALMTDSDVVYLASQPILDYSHYRQVTVAEIIPALQGKEIRWWEPDLAW